MNGEYEYLLKLSFRSAAVWREESAVLLAETDSSPIKLARNDNGQECIHETALLRKLVSL
jgi:hypothetical protein